MSTTTTASKNPLDEYRQKSTFDSKKLRLYLDTEEIIKYEQEYYKKLVNEPSFKQSTIPQTLDQLRYQTFQQAKALKKFKSVEEHLKESVKNEFIITRILTQFVPDTIPKQSVIFLNHIKKMSTERHRALIEDIYRNKAMGCFCLTEIAHGSNLRGLGTKATYDRESKCFILNTPNFESAKCWSGGLGQSATHAAVFANLEVDGTKYGLQSFIVPIRDVKTLLPFAGVTVGDMGEKNGLNGVDNGFMMFKNYKIPRENLLNKLCDVTEDGVFLSKVEKLDKNKDISRIALSIARLSTVARNESLGTKALTIAIRYAAIRKQFGPQNLPEVPILEYQTHQYRLFPYLAATFIFKHAWMYLADIQDNIHSFTTEKSYTTSLGSELHAIACSSKAITGWTMRDAIQNCREACGGHGYLKASGFGDLRNTQDPILTYDGENYVILREAGNFLIKLWPLIRDNKKISSPLQSLDFLSNANDILMNSKFTIKTLDELFDQNYILFIYDWLVVYLLKTSSQKLEENSKVLSNFWAQADNQIFHAKDLAVAYIERFFLMKFRKLIDNAPDDEIREVLSDIFYLYAVWSLKKHLAVLYQGGFACGASITSFFNEGILVLLKKVKNNAVALVDAIAPPDFILNSVLGLSDGQVYDHLEDLFLSNQQTRVTWWKEILSSKL